MVIKKATGFGTIKVDQPSFFGADAAAFTYFGIPSSTGAASYDFAILRTASAVNYLQVTGSTTGNPLIIEAKGSDTNINIQLKVKGSTGVVDISGGVGLNLPSGANIYVAETNPKKTIILSASGGTPTTTAGCSASTQVESTTNDVNYFVLDYDTTTEESAFWNVQMPDSWDGGVLTARFIWTTAAGLATETVRWGIKARAFVDSDAIDQAFGTEVTVDDTFLAQGDVHISSATAGITVGGSPGGASWVTFNVARKTASDNLTGDARLIAVQLEYGVGTFSD